MSLIALALSYLTGCTPSDKEFVCTEKEFEAGPDGKAWICVDGYLKDKPVESAPTQDSYVPPEAPRLNIKACTGGGPEPEGCKQYHKAIEDFENGRAPAGARREY